MNSDIRVLASLKGHPKLFKLEKRIGDGAVKALLWIWITASQVRPEGELTGWDDEDIAAAAMWDGEPAELVDALIACGWLDKKQDFYVLHDWSEHQGWACGAKARTEKARNAARAKWAKRNGKSA